MTNDPAIEDPTPQAEEPVDAAESDSRVLTIDRQTIPLAERGDLVWSELVRKNDARRPDVLVRGNQLVRMTERGALEEYTPDSLRSLISRRVEYEKQGRGGTVVIPEPPKEDPRELLSRDSAEYVDAPRVDRVVDVPVVGRTGKLITEPGYDAESRLFYRPAEGLENLRVPTADDVSTIAQVLDARDFIGTELLGDFGFDDAASRAHAFALLLLPFVRELISDGPTPLHGVFAPEPSSGKTLLAQACLAPGCGLVAPHSGSGKDDAEWRKVITSALMSGAPAILFDNLHGTLSSPAFASALTTGRWSDRALGTNQQVDLPVRNVWVATANNPQITTEHVRRIAPIFLEPGPVRPGDRPRSSWRHDNLLHKWAIPNRARLVEAALILVRHWLEGPALADPYGSFEREEGSTPMESRASLGSFERWAGVIGGILEAADVKGFLDPANRERLKDDADDEHRDAAAFFEAWHALGREWMTSAELAELCELSTAPLHATLPAEAWPSNPSKQTLTHSLGKWLGKNKGRRIGGYQLLGNESSRHVRSWLVKSAARP